MRRIFAQVRDVDFHAPPPQAARGLLGPEKKVADLRDHVRRLERDLARLAAIWDVKDAQIAALDAILDSGAAQRRELEGRAERADTARRRAPRQQAEEVLGHRALVATLSGKRAELEAAVGALTAQRIQREEVLQAELAALRGQVGQLQASLEHSEAQGRDDAARFAAAQHEADGAHAELLARLDETLHKNDAQAAQAQAQYADLRKEHEARLARLSHAEAQWSGAEQKIEGRDRTLTALADQMTERDATISAMATQMAEARAQHAQHLGDAQATLHSCQQEVAQLRGALAELTAKLELADAQQARDQAQAEQQAQRVAGLTQDTLAGQQKLEDVTAQLQQAQALQRDLQASLATAQRDLSARHEDASEPPASGS